MKFFQMSIYGAVLVLIIFLIRLLFIDKIPKKTFNLFWSIAICRFLVPFSLPSKLSIYSLFQDEIGVFSKSVGSIIETNFIASSSGHIVNIPQLRVGSNILRTTDFWITTLIMGAILLLVMFLISYFENMKKFKESVPAENEFIGNWVQTNMSRIKFEIRISERITSPLTYGVFHPVILLPKSLDFKNEESLNYILLHEITHIENFDFLKKILLNLVVCVHWFNPLVWLMYILANRDIEICCDEGVVKKIGREFKNSYALTLLNMMERNVKLKALNLGFSRYSVKDRVVSLMKMKRISFLGMFLAFVLVLSTTVVFATTQEIDFLRVEKILPKISTEEIYVDWTRLQEHNVNFTFYSQNRELFVNNFYNIYEIASLQSIFPEFTEVYSVGFRLDENFEYIKEVRINFDGDWLDDVEFSEKYPDHTFSCFFPVINSFVKLLKNNYARILTGYYAM